MKTGDKGTVYVLVEHDPSMGKDGYRELIDQDAPDSPVFQDEILDGVKNFIADAVRQYDGPVFIMKRTQELIAQVRACPTCGADLTRINSISRLYVSKSDDAHDASCLGHLDENGDFEPDTDVSYPLENHDLLDNSDECQSCGATV